ncbi:MAG: hypothetical protein ACKVOH_06735 [Chlamydiales bacterium]
MACVISALAFDLSQVDIQGSFLAEEEQYRKELYSAIPAALGIGLLYGGAALSATIGALSIKHIDPFNFPWELKWKILLTAASGTTFLTISIIAAIKIGCRRKNDLLAPKKNYITTEAAIEEWRSHLLPFEGGLVKVGEEYQLLARGPGARIYSFTATTTAKLAHAKEAGSLDLVYKRRRWTIISFLHFDSCAWRDFLQYVQNKGSNGH